MSCGWCKLQNGHIDLYVWAFVWKKIGTLWLEVSENVSSVVFSILTSIYFLQFFFIQFFVSLGPFDYSKIFRALASDQIRVMIWVEKKQIWALPLYQKAQGTMLLYILKSKGNVKWARSCSSFTKPFNQEGIFDSTIKNFRSHQKEEQSSLKMLMIFWTLNFCFAC